MFENFNPNQHYVWNLSYDNRAENIPKAKEYSMRQNYTKCNESETTLKGVDKRHEYELQ